MWSSKNEELIENLQRTFLVIVDPFLILNNKSPDRNRSTCSGGSNSHQLLISNSSFTNSNLGTSDLPDVYTFDIVLASNI